MVKVSMPIHLSVGVACFERMMTAGIETILGKCRGVGDLD